MIQNCMSEQQRRNAVQILLTLDKKDYEEGMPVFEKYSTRGVIIRDGKIATQHGSAGDYKILGGGVEPGEKLEDALIREVGEESGLIVIPESTRKCRGGPCGRPRAGTSPAPTEHFGRAVPAAADLCRGRRPRRPAPPGHRPAPGGCGHPTLRPSAAE